MQKINFNSGQFVLVAGLSDAMRAFNQNFAASETCSARQVPALNPAKHQTGFTGPALGDVNAQDLNALLHTLIPPVYKPPRRTC